MEFHGLSYRVRLSDGRKINLGRDLQGALSKYFLLHNTEKDMETVSDEGVLAMWRRHKKGASQREIEFTITTDEILKVLQVQGHRCAVTLLPFKDGKPIGMRIRPWAASIDRINGGKGYLAGNIRVVCAFVNVAMNGFGESFFEQVLEPLIEARSAAKLLLK